jgi:hypothetical protein
LFIQRRQVGRAVQTSHFGIGQRAFKNGQAAEASWRGLAQHRIDGVACADGETSAAAPVIIVRGLFELRPRSGIKAQKHSFVDLRLLRIRENVFLHEVTSKKKPSRG